MHRILATQTVKGFLQNSSRRYRNSRKDAYIFAPPNSRRHYSSSLVGSPSTKLGTPINGDLKGMHLNGDICTKISEAPLRSEVDISTTTNDNPSTTNNIALLSNMIQGSYAIFIDAQNIPTKHCELAQKHINSSISPPHVLSCIKRMYGHIQLLKNEAWSQFSVEQDFWISICPKLHNIDILMAMDIAESLYKNPHIKTYILMTCDGDFAPLVHKLREAGKIVIVYGHQQMSTTLANTAHCYVNTTKLLAVEEERISAETALKEEEERKEQDRKLTETRILQKRKEEDTKLFDSDKDKECILDIIRVMQQTSTNVEGWMSPGLFGRGDALIEHKKYGYSKLLTLLKDIPELEFKMENEQPYIRMSAEERLEVKEKRIDQEVGMNLAKELVAERQKQMLVDKKKHVRQQQINYITGLLRDIFTNPFTSVGSSKEKATSANELTDCDKERLLLLSTAETEDDKKEKVIEQSKKESPTPAKGWNLTGFDKTWVLDIVRVIQQGFANEEGWFNPGILGHKGLIKYKHYGYSKLLQ